MLPDDLPLVGHFLSKSILAGCVVQLWFKILIIIYPSASFLETIDTNSDEAFNDINELDDEEETTETSEPSKDIDLGSVQEV